jgi:hypothetical protein
MPLAVEPNMEKIPDNIDLERPYDWSFDKLLEIKLETPEDFLVIKETLTRMGVSSKREKKLFQSVHILHKHGKYYLMSFLELFALDGRQTNMTYRDIARRNTISKLIEQWGLADIVSKDRMQPQLPVSEISIVLYKDKRNWQLCSKYTIGQKKNYKSF